MLARGKLLLHPTCSAEKRCGFPGLVGLGKEGLNPDEKKIWEPTLKERKQEKGCCRQPCPHWEALQPPRSRGTGLPGRLLLPISHQQKWPHPSWHQRSRRAGAQRRRATPERQDGLSPLLSSHGCGLGAGWVGLGPPGQYLCERARATGKGAAWRGNARRREKRLPLGRRGFGSPLRSVQHPNTHIFCAGTTCFPSPASSGPQALKNTASRVG